MIGRNLISVFFINILFFSAQIQAETIRSGPLKLTCQLDNQQGMLSCDYRFNVPMPPAMDISVKMGSVPLSLSGKETYPWDNATTVILFLVDTSDPGREAAVRKIASDINQFLDTSNGIHKFGLYSFDKDLVQLAAIGSSKQEIIDAAKKLHATGKTTELYRNVISAINILDNIDADRKSIFLFSDGLAEDKAYFQNDVVKSAQDADVIINSFGYPRSVSQSVSLQTIRRLSEETHGKYIETDNSFSLPNNFAADLFSTIDNGGKFSVKIPGKLEASSNKIPVLDINIETKDKQLSVQYPYPKNLIIPVKETVRIESAPAPASTTPTQQQVKIITQKQSDTDINYWFWYGIPILLLIILIAIMIFFFIVTFKQTKKSAKSHANQMEFKPFAYLVTQDEKKLRYAITRTTWRIGRGRDNEMILHDNSVSRRHAEIHRDQGDVFTLYDLDSLNGVFVDGERINKRVLHEGNIIEIGDVCLRFTLMSSEYSVEESTIMQNTRAPLAH